MRVTIVSTSEHVTIILYSSTLLSCLGVSYRCKKCESKRAIIAQGTCLEAQQSCLQMANIYQTSAMHSRLAQDFLDNLQCKSALQPERATSLQTLSSCCSPSSACCSRGILP